MRIIVWGAGYTGKVVLSRYPVISEQVVQIVDSDPLLLGKKIIGLSIQSPLVLDETADCILITVKKKNCIESIQEFLRIRGYKKRVYLIDEFIQEYKVVESKDCLFTFTEAMDMPLDEIRDRLQDDISRKLFEARLYAYSTWDVSIFIKTLVDIERADGVLPILESYHVKVKDDKLTWLKKQIQMNPKDRKPIILVGINESQLQMLKNFELNTVGYINITDGIAQGNYGLDVPELSIEESIKLYSEAWYLSTLCDDESIKKKIVEKGVNGDRFLKYHTCWRTQYFDEEFLVPDKGGVFIDCGVYDLKNSLEYINWCDGDYENIYAIEPDTVCYNRCTSRLKKMQQKDQDRINIINAAAGERSGKILFDAFESEERYEVPVCTIDDVLKGCRVTYIKMDIEGAELSALKGSIKSIQKWKPRLAICIYHKRKDIYEIPLYILSLRPDYKFYIRQYASCSAETVLYCV